MENKKKKRRLTLSIKRYSIRKRTKIMRSYLRRPKAEVPEIETEKLFIADPLKQEHELEYEPKAGVSGIKHENSFNIEFLKEEPEFDFPKGNDVISASTRNEWVKRCKRPQQFNPYTSQICSNHFTDDNYLRDLQNELLGIPLRKRLKKSAVPSLHLPTEEQFLEIINLVIIKKRMLDRRMKKYIELVGLHEKFEYQPEACVSGIASEKSVDSECSKQEPEFEATSYPIIKTEIKTETLDTEDHPLLPLDFIKREIDEYEIKAENVDSFVEYGTEVEESQLYVDNSASGGLKNSNGTSWSQS